MLMTGEAWAFAEPTAGDPFFPVWEFVHETLLKGSIAFVMAAIGFLMACFFVVQRNYYGSIITLAVIVAVTQVQKVVVTLGLSL